LIRQYWQEGFEMLKKVQMASGKHFALSWYQRLTKEEER